MILTDTHAHLYAEEFEADRSEVIASAQKEGVQRFFLPNIDSSSIAGLLSLTKSFPESCFAMMGLHPCSVKENYAEELGIVESWLEKNNVISSNERFYAIGEIGIDLYWDKAFFEEQQLAFRKQIDLAKQYDLPIVIHMRNSFKEVFRNMEELNENRLKGIFHCFSGTLEEAKKIIGLGGFYLGIGGVLTFKNSGLDKVVKEIDLKHIVLETDSPYLAPFPHRGKRNESAYISIIAKKVAEMKNISVEEVAEVTTENSRIIFGV